jgi:hypothetical protein
LYVGGTQDVEVAGSALGLAVNSGHLVSRQAVHAHGAAEDAVQHHKHLVDRAGAELALGDEHGTPLVDPVGGDRLDSVAPNSGRSRPVIVLA